MRFLAEVRCEKLRPEIFRLTERLDYQDPSAIIATQSRSPKVAQAGLQVGERLSLTISRAGVWLRAALNRGDVRLGGRPPLYRRSLWRFSARRGETRLPSNKSASAALAADRAVAARLAAGSGGGASGGAGSAGGGSAGGGSAGSGSGGGNGTGGAMATAGAMAQVTAMATAGAMVEATVMAMVEVTAIDRLFPSGATSVCPIIGALACGLLFRDQCHSGERRATSGEVERTRLIRSLPS